MPVLTEEQRIARNKRKAELYSSGELEALSKDYSVSTWWSSASDKLDDSFTQQDQDRTSALREYVENSPLLDKKGF